MFNGSLLRKAAFPREALPIASVLFAFAQLLLALAVFLPAMALASGPGLTLDGAAARLRSCSSTSLFTIGVALLLAALTTAWRDVAHFTEVGLVLVFWLTPIVYPAEMVPGPWRSALALSPPAAFAAAYQDVLFWGRLPAWTTAASTLVSTVAAARPRPRRVQDDEPELRGARLTWASSSWPGSRSASSSGTTRPST